MYDKVSESLLDGDRKRDQIIAFYTVITGALVGLITGDKEIGLNNEQHWYLIMIGVVGINYLAAKTISNYRIFHMKYSISMQALQRLLFNTEESEIQSWDTRTSEAQRQINNYYCSIYRHPLKNSKSFVIRIVERLKFPFSSTENLIYMFFVNVSFINVFIVAPASIRSLGWMLFCYFLYLAIFIYGILLHSILFEWNRIHEGEGKKQLKREYREGEQAVFDGIDIRLSKGWGAGDGEQVLSY